MMAAAQVTPFRAPRPYRPMRPQRRLRVRFAGLGEVPPDSAILLQVAPASFQQNMGKYWKGLDAYIQQGLRTGQLPPYTEERCSGVAPLDKKTLISNLASQGLTAVGTVASGAAAAAVGAAVPGVSVVNASGAVVGTASSAPTGVAAGLAAAAPFLLVGAAVVGVIAAIFSHHAQAVAKEQTTMCAAVPGANEALAWIDSEFRAGRISKDAALAGLDELLRNFEQYVAPVMKDTGNGKTCNLACGYRRVLQAIVAKKRAEYSEAPTAALGILSGGGIGELLPWAAVAAVAWAVIS